MNKKVAILGKLPTKLKAPFDDKSWDIWTLNYQNEKELPRIDLWFDIHRIKPNPRADIKLNDYPLEEAIELVGGKYFNGSVAYMIAYAILKDYREIALYGMMFDNDKESRAGEYHNVRELIFFAKGRGIKVTAPYDGIMLKEYELYGI